MLGLDAWSLTVSNLHVFINYIQIDDFISVSATVLMSAFFYFKYSDDFQTRVLAQVQLHVGIITTKSLGALG